MKKLILVGLSVWSSLFLHAQVNLKISAGAYVVNKGNAQFVMDTGSMVNNGTYMDSTGLFVASGGVTFSGTGTTRLNNFTASNGQHSTVNSLVSVYNTANVAAGGLNANNNLYIRSDANTVANLVVSGILTNNVKGIIARASATSGACPSYTSHLSLNISGPVVNYQWQSSPDSVSWTNVGGAIASTYTAIVNAKIFYRCSLSATNSSFSEATPGVKLAYGPLPNAGSITGPSSVTSGSNIALTDAAGGGTWSASNGNATVSGGLVSGLTAGTVNISYSVTNSCGTATTAKLITVSSSTAGAISGTPMVCVGATTSLTDASTGGAWSSSNNLIATVGTSGIVTGATAGTATISYTISGVPATIIVTVNSNPSGIGGANSVCNGMSITLSDFVGGGAWSSTSGLSLASGTATSVTLVTGTTVGTNTVTYVLATGCYATYNVTVKTPPTPILGTLTVCAPGSVTFLSDLTTSSSWSVNPVTVATVTASGRVYGVSVGTAIVTFTGTNGCTVTAIVTVASPIAAIGNNLPLCQTATTTLSDVTGGGNWASNNTAVATVGSATGTVNGVAGGTTSISYILPGTGCYVTAILTINPSPNSGALVGSGIVCAGSTMTLSDPTGSAGGTWTSTNPAVGTVGTTGIVRGIAQGTTTISYTVTNICGSSAATALVTVNPLPVAGTITGVTSVCSGSLTTLTDASVGGVWISSNSNASVDGFGDITGNTVGTATISYTVTNSCGTARATAVVTVNGVSAGSISGASSVIEGFNITLSDAATGGIWTSETPTVATIGSTGVLTGVMPGTVNISYTVTNGCGSAYSTKVVTVNVSPVAAITGTAGVCLGATTPLTDATSGGAWTTSNSLIATVNSSGIVTGVAVGTAKISYTVSGIPAILVVTVNTVPSGIGGGAAVCNGASITLSDFTVGGTWTSSLGVSVTTGTTITTVTGLTNGANTVTYSLADGCYKTYPVTVNASPVAISGTFSVCAGSSVRLSDATSVGISWTSSTTSVATINGAGVVVGVSGGTTLITYTVSTGCRAMSIVTVYALPVVSAIMGASSVSHTGSSITLSDTIAGGVWSSGNTAILTVGSSGIVTAVAASGSANINYIVTNTLGCSGFASKLISARPAPPVRDGSSTTFVGSTLNLADEVTGGEWTSSDISIAVVDGNGTVTALALGNVTVSHIIINSNGDMSTLATQLTVNPLPFEIRLLPNPNKGAFVVVGTVGSNSDDTVVLEIADMLGQVVYNTETKATGGALNEHVLLNSNLSNGMYLLNVRTARGNKSLHFAVEK